MTHNQIDLLEAGDELDELVRAAIAYQHRDDPGFMPSYDWNSALDALEQIVGPYKACPASSASVSFDPGVVVATVYDHDNAILAISDHHNGPVAICRAILKSVRK